MAVANLLNNLTTRNRAYALLGVGGVDGSGKERFFALGFRDMNASVIEQRLIEAIPQWTEPWVQKLMVADALCKESADAAVAASNYEFIESMRARRLFTDDQAERLLTVLRDVAPPDAVPAPQEPKDEGDDRIGKLKTLADLRDSGALTEAEFQAEKARLLQPTRGEATS